MTNKPIYTKISLSFALSCLAEQTVDVYIWAGTEYELVLPDMSISEFIRKYIFKNPTFYIKE